ncbi:MAG TPA: hypothetical protein VHF06_25895 [Pseudonocardiaceae bacterium]|nr:hypothetical protein [Pseudonocardiaceae bacterium]
MNDQVLPAAVRDAAAAGFAEVTEEFGERAGGAPTLAEFLEILGWAVPVGSDATDGTFPLPLPLTVKLAGNKRYRSPAESRVGDLDDALFVDTSDHTAALIDALRADQGSPVTPRQFAAAVLEVLRTGHLTFADVEADDIRDVTANVPAKRVAKPRIGDVLAIPAKQGGYHLAVVLARNSFGTALGLFGGVSATGRLTDDLRRSPRRFPVYTDDEQVKQGAWRVVGHDESLLSSFPASPEIYHKPGAWEGVGIDTGEFGVAESPGDGALRKIDADEAAAVGLTDGSYRQGHMSEHLAPWLDAGHGSA